MTNPLILKEDTHDNHLTYVRDYPLPAKLAEKDVRYEVYHCDELGDQYEIGIVWYGNNPDVLFVQSDWDSGLQEPDEDIGFRVECSDGSKIDMHWVVFMRDDDGEWRRLYNAVVLTIIDGLPRLFNY